MLIKIDTERNVEDPVWIDEVWIFDPGTILYVDSGPHIGIVVNVTLLCDSPEAVPSKYRVLDETLDRKNRPDLFDQLLDVFNLVLSIWKECYFLGFQPFQVSVPVPDEALQSLPCLADEPDRPRKPVNAALALGKRKVE